MVQLQSTPLKEIEQKHALLWKTFKAGTCRPLEYRRNQLYQLARMMQDNADALADAIHEDLDKPKLEAQLMEVGAIVERSLKSAEALEEWCKPVVCDVPEWQKPWGAKLYKVAKGPVLGMAPWNYPLILSMQPLVAAISAGCPTVIKPSELAPATAQLLAELFPKYLDSNAYAVVNGGIEEATKLLELKWGHISYTGNGRVGRIVATAAAKHLTPVTLELGGKSPVIIDPQYDISLAAKRILWGKCCNSGQTCVAPDYILIPADKQAELVAAFKEHTAAFYPEGSALQSKSYSRIVSPAHYARLKGLLGRTKGKVAVGGSTDDSKLRFEPTFVADVKADDALMEEEIFGPILPIVPVSSIDEAIAFVNDHDDPLALYAFTDRPEIKAKLLEQTLSGSMIFNDALQQLSVDELAFSGVGESGYGYQNLQYGFDSFTHYRSSIDMPKEAEPFLGIRYPPYTEKAFKILTASVHKPIPVANGV